MAAHNSWVETADVILIVFLALAAGLEFTFLRTTFNVGTTERFVFGILLLLSAWSLILWARLQLAEHQQKSAPGYETATLITNGIFHYSRNPIYLGMVLIAPAVAFLFDSLWVLAATIPIAFVIHDTLIIPEERYLARRFGSQWNVYCARVNRWF